MEWWDILGVAKTATRAEVKARGVKLLPQNDQIVGIGNGSRTLADFIQTSRYLIDATCRNDISNEREAPVDGQSTGQCRIAWSF